MAVGGGTGLTGRNEFLRVLSVLEAAVHYRVVDAREIPTVAAWPVAEGVDDDDLVGLAGLDLGPFDPRDARQALSEFVESVGSRLPRPEALDVAAATLARAVLSTTTQPERALRRFYELAVEADYPDDDAVMQLYGLDDEWHGGWGRLREQIAIEVDALLTLLATRGPVAEVVTEAAVRSL
ncbi:MAG: hypothetical protein AAGA37_01865 [Actinomycetota bacterium]